MNPANDEAPGWDAIDTALARVYGGQEPHHWATDFEKRLVLGGPEVLDGISAYASGGEHRHWHYVTYGLSELYAKEEGGDPEVSGCGFEFTIRAQRTDDLPPLWPIAVLRGVARAIVTSGYPTFVGQWFRASKVAGLAGGSTDLVGFGCVLDEDLGELETPNGRMAFLQLVGLREEEVQFWAEHGLEAFLAGPGAGLPKLLTLPQRPSLLG